MFDACLFDIPIDIFLLPQSILYIVIVKITIVLFVYCFTFRLFICRYQLYCFTSIALLQRIRQFSGMGGHLTYTFYSLLHLLRVLQNQL